MNMPTHTKEIVWTEKTVATTPAGYYSVSDRTFKSIKSRTFPITVKRALPKDLFVSGTARTTSSSFTNETSADNGRYSAPYTTVVTGGPASVFWNTSYGSIPTLPPVDYELIYNKIRSDMRGEAVNLANALAEYRKTAKLFLACARAVGTRGKSLAGAMKQKSGKSKAWLGFQYGVKPLVSDILGSIDELKAAASQPIYIHGVESRRFRNVNRSEVRHLSTFYDFTGNFEGHASRRVRVRWRAKYSPNAVFNVLVAHGFTNPFALAYELTPYSFVLDWWINLGEVLSSLDNLLLFDELRVIRSNSYVTGRYITSQGFTRNNGRNYVQPHSWSVITRTDTRYAPEIISRIVSIRYKPSVSLTHIANGLALLRVARSRF